MCPALIIIGAKERRYYNRGHKDKNIVRTGTKRGGGGRVNIGAISFENSLSLKWHLGEGWYTVKKGYRFSRPRRDS